MEKKGKIFFLGKKEKGKEERTIKESERKKNILERKKRKECEEERMKWKKRKESKVVYCLYLLCTLNILLATHAAVKPLDSHYLET